MDGELAYRLLFHFRRALLSIFKKQGLTFYLDSKVTSVQKVEDKLHLEYKDSQGKINQVYSIYTSSYLQIVC